MKRQELNFYDDFKLNKTLCSPGAGGGGGVVRAHVPFRAKLYIFTFDMSRPPGKVRVTSSDQVRFFCRGHHAKKRRRNVKSLNNCFCLISLFSDWFDE